MGAKPGHEVSDETRAKISATLKAKPKRIETEAQKEQRAAALAARWAKYRAENQGVNKTCTIEGCDRKIAARGWCATHYNREVNGAVPRDQFKPASGADNSQWKGGEIGYSAAHLRAKRKLARECEACGTTEGRLEIALMKNGDPANYRDDPHGPYSVDPGDYARLCVTCHRRYDSPRLDTRQPVITALRVTRRNA